MFKVDVAVRHNRHRGFLIAAAEAGQMLRNLAIGGRAAMDHPGLVADAEHRGVGLAAVELDLNLNRLNRRFGAAGRAAAFLREVGGQFVFRLLERLENEENQQQEHDVDHRGERTGGFFVDLAFNRHSLLS